MQWRKWGFNKLMVILLFTSTFLCLAGSYSRPRNDVFRHRQFILARVLPWNMHFRLDKTLVTHKSLAPVAGISNGTLVSRYLLSQSLRFHSLESETGSHRLNNLQGLTNTVRYYGFQSNLSHTLSLQIAQ